MKTLTLLFCLVATVAAGQIQKKQYPPRDYYFVPGGTITDSFEAVGRLDIVVESVDTSTYQYTITKLKKVWPQDSVLVQAASYVDMSGIVNTAGILGGVDKADWIKYTVNFKKKRTALVYRYAMSDATSGKVEFRTGSITGPIIASIDLPPTGGWGTFVNKSVTIDFGSNGNTDIYLTFTGSPRTTGAGGNIAYWCVK